MRFLIASIFPLFLCTSVHAQALFPSGLQGWTVENGDAAFFQVIDSNLLRVSGNAGWLRSTEPYADFELRGQVRFVEPDSDSGIFLRVEPGTDFIRGWPGDAYQVQMREISVNPSDSPLPLAHLYRHRVADGPTTYERERVFSLYRGVGEWQDFVISVEGDTLTVDLNGERVTEASGLENLSGHIGFQSEAGSVEYRELEIQLLTNSPQ